MLIDINEKDIQKKQCVFDKKVYCGKANSTHFSVPMVFVGSEDAGKDTQNNADMEMIISSKRLCNLHRSPTCKRCITVSFACKVFVPNVHTNEKAHGENLYDKENPIDKPS